MKREHLFIVNPTAGRYDCTRKIKEAVAAAELTEPCHLFVTENAGQASDVVRKYAQQCSGTLYVYACGGDGTLNEVVNGAFTCPNCVVGVIPTGSGNDFIKYFGSDATSRFSDIKKLANGSVHVIDLMMLEGKASINIISAGYDADVAARIPKLKKLPFIGGSLAYNISVGISLINAMRNKYTLIADDAEVPDKDHDYLFAIAANGRFYGSGFNAAPYALLDDGYIDFIRIPTVSRLTFLKLVGDFKRGEHLEKLPFVKLQHCKKLQIIAEHPIPVNFDGEIITCVNPTVEIKEKALKILIPE